MAFNRTIARNLRYDGAKPLSFKVGDNVYLRVSHLAAIQPSEKLTARFYGPFKVTEVVTPVAYRLEIPRDGPVECHDVFHVSKLRACSDDEKPPVVLEGSPLCMGNRVIECILSICS
eukprot:Nk52_evm2s2120 gene=Nk52_evmTU2s2120